MLSKLVLGCVCGVASAETSTEAFKPVMVDGFNEAQLEQLNENGEKHEFQAEVSRLMDIIINSLYTDKQVFLRELISNAADALEKMRFLSVQDESMLGEKKDLDIRVEFDATNKTLSITDSGIGMSKSDLINNLGTVAKSGTTNFLEAMQEASDSTNLIGQFGVGFYSAFLVADKVTVTSKNNDDETQHVWESAADASFSIVEDPRGNTLGRGTRLTLHLKEDALDYLSETQLKDVISKYSQFVQYPIYLRIQNEVEVTAEDEAADAEEAEDEEQDVESEDKDAGEEDDDPSEDTDKPAEKKTKKVWEWDQINMQKAIWLRDPKDVSGAEYDEFYKGVSKQYMPPAHYHHFTAEGEVDFKSILYVPGHNALPGMNQGDNWEAKADIKLFVRRVLVAENALPEGIDILPKWLNFIKGVIDSDDLPLNVSREQLQQNKTLKIISKKLVRKVLEMLKRMSQDDEETFDKLLGDEELDDDEEATPEDKTAKLEAKARARREPSKYENFWGTFGTHIKLGCVEDAANKSKIGKLLRFHSNKSEGKLISLQRYMDRMPEKQTTIYYASGPDMVDVARLPNLEWFEKKDIEVFFFHDRMDESCIERLADFEGKKFVSIQKEGTPDKYMADDVEQKKHKKVANMFEPFTTWYAGVLQKLTNTGAMKESGLKASKVVVTSRLTDSPAVLVATEFGWTPYMERLMKANGNQSGGSAMLQAPWMMEQARAKVLEINPAHPLIKALYAQHKMGENLEELEHTAGAIFQIAVIDSGIELGDPTAFAGQVYRLMSQKLGVDSTESVEDIELPPTPEAEEEVEDLEEDEKTGLDEKTEVDEEDKIETEDKIEDLVKDEEVKTEEEVKKHEEL